MFNDQFSMFKYLRDGYIEAQRIQHRGVEFQHLMDVDKLAGQLLIEVFGPLAAVLEERIQRDTTVSKKTYLSLLVSVAIHYNYFALGESRIFQKNL